MCIFFKSYLLNILCSTTNCFKMDILYVAKFWLYTYTSLIYYNKYRLPNFSVLLCLPLPLLHYTENRWLCTCPQKCVCSSETANFSLPLYSYCQGLFFLCHLLRKMNGSSCILSFSRVQVLLDVCVKVGNGNMSCRFSSLFVKSESKTARRCYYKMFFSATFW